MKIGEIISYQINAYNKTLFITLCDQNSKEKIKAKTEKFYVGDLWDK